MSSFLNDLFSDPQRRDRWIGALLALSCLAWIAVSSWKLLAEVPATALFENHTMPVVQERMSKCEGTFQQRYDCKQAILLAGERGGMERVFDRLLFTVAPPALLWIAWSALRRRRRHD
jgi:hypothetical protein